MVLTPDRPLPAGRRPAPGRADVRRARARHPAVVDGGASSLMIVGFGMFYGGVMGTYGGVAGDRSLQLLYSAIKVPFLIMTTFAAEPAELLRHQHASWACGAISPRVLRALMTTQAGLTVILTSLAPVHGVLVRLGHRLSAGDPVQRGDVRRGQLRRPVDAAPRIRAARSGRTTNTAGCCGPGSSSMSSWASRWPGCSGRSSATPQRPVQFFREDSWSNAYEVVLQMIWEVLTGQWTLRATDPTTVVGLSPFRQSSVISSLDRLAWSTRGERRLLRRFNHHECFVGRRLPGGDDPVPIRPVARPAGDAGAPRRDDRRRAFTA